MTEQSMRPALQFPRSGSLTLLYFTAVLALVLSPPLRAEDAYYRVALTNLNITERALPRQSPGAPMHGGAFSSLAMIRPYATVDGEGEAYVTGNFNPWTSPEELYRTVFLAVRAPADKEVTGLIFVPKPDHSGMARLPFKIAAGTNGPATKKQFYQAKGGHYRELRSRDIPGGAWFRHEEEEADAVLTGKPASVSQPNNVPVRRRRPESLDETYGLFTGGRAVSENLQLDRALPAAGANEAMVDLASIPGIKTEPMDWKAVIQGLKPETDPLAASIPADQHALFFPSFGAMVAIMDEADTNGTPFLQMIEPRAEDMDTRHRYQKQLCLGLSELSRQVGSSVVDAIALTGSDPYLRMGTDVGVLLQTKNPTLLKSLITAQQGVMSAAGGSDAKAVTGEIDGVAYNGVVSPDRSVCSYLASVGDVVFVSNSLEQLGRMLAANKGTTPALVSQDEYIFFRNRYRRGDLDESAFLVLSDAAIRRWCGPRWRIADSRRTRAAAALAELQASQLDALVKGTAKEGRLQNDFKSPDLGELTVTRNGVFSSSYGALNFLKPISEIPLAQVTASEAEAYGRWRDSYQQNWSQSFDPIAARFSMRPGQIGFEVTVMPLIARTDYRDMVSLSSGAQIKPDAGDAHAGALAHLMFAIDPKSAPAMQAGTFLGTMSPALKVNPLSWLGSSIAIYADDDSFWNELQAATNADEFFEKRYWDLPIALRFEVANPLGAAAFLSALRAYSDQTAPGMTSWGNRDYKGRTYVRVTSADLTAPSGNTNTPAVFYASSPDSLVVTFSEALLKRSLDREITASDARKKGEPVAQAGKPWLGTNLCLQLDQRFFAILGRILDNEYQSTQQRLAWNNLPILNEWKHRFPSEDPVKLHERFWQMKLICPGGGSYVWNDKWQTMESTVYGHPGEPKKGPINFGPLAHVSNANLGVSFENQGLSARAVFMREEK